MNITMKHKRPTLHWGLSTLLIVSFSLAACGPVVTPTSVPIEPPSVVTEDQASTPTEEPQVTTPTEEPQPLPSITILDRKSVV